MLLNKTLLIFLTIFISFNLYSVEKDVSKFFEKVQSKKMEKLKKHLTMLDDAKQKKVISIISKYDKEIFKLRKPPKHRKYMNSMSCEDRLLNVENHLKDRKKILDLQLKKIEELKSLNLDCKVLDNIVDFERRFMRKLRKIIRRQHRNANKNRFHE